MLLLMILNQIQAAAPDTALNLTPEETAWLNENKDNIRYGPNPYWPPGDYMENGEHKGIVADYIKIFENNSVLPLKAPIMTIGKRFITA